MAKFLQLVDGLPTMVEVPGTAAAYDESTLFSSGLAANTPITLPNSGSFNSSTAKDILVILNDLAVEETRDFTVVGASAPFTQIQFVYALSNDSVVRFKQNL